MAGENVEWPWQRQGKWPPVIKHDPGQVSVKRNN